MSKRNIQDGTGTRKKSKNCEDRLSNFPGLIISHILSLMPTKDAVRTSVLSKAWEFKWTCIYNVDIDDMVVYRQHAKNFFRKNSTRMMVVNFVERVVLLSRYVTSLCLLLSIPLRYDVDRIAAWICAVSVGNNLESLVVHYEQNRFDFVLPRSLLHSTMLRNLELKIMCTFKVPARVSFPNLKTLILYGVNIVHESSTCDTLTLSFPLLETLTFHNCHCKLSNVKMVEVHAPALTTFHRTFSEYGYSPDDLWFNIISTRLVEFRFQGKVPGKFILMGQNVVCAELRYGNNNTDHEAVRIHAKNLLNEFPNLKNFNTSCYFTKVIAQSTVGVPLPVLHHLVRLVVSGRSQVYGKGLLALLHATPNLKFLQTEAYDYDTDDYDCDAVEHVPLCIKNQLVEIEFQGFDKRSVQMSLVKYLLKNGRTLKKVYICYAGKLTKEEERSIPKQMSALPNCSTDLSFIFNENVV